MRKWVRHRYFERVVVTTLCPFCLDYFTYEKISKPRKYCTPCGRNYHRERMRELNAGYRKLKNERLRTV